MTWRNRIVGHANVDPKEINLNPKNWRQHPEAQAKALAGVLDEVGYVAQVIVNKQTGNAIDGHLRVALALKNKQPTVPVVFVDLDEAEKAKILATFDPLSAMATSSPEKLDALLRDVETGDAALQEMLAGLAKDAGLYLGTEPEEAPEAQIDKAAELQEKWKTESGQLWTIKSPRWVYCPECNKLHKVPE